MTDIYEQRHVLFCDILGFSAAVMKPDAFAGRFLIAFSHLARAVREANRRVDSEEIDPVTGKRPDYVVSPTAKQFSDCVVVSTPATNVDAIWLCELAASLQNELARRRFLSRGAITTGPLYHKETTIFGPAFVQAVQLEEATVWPRIEVSKETVEVFLNGDTNTDREISAIRKRQLLIQERSGVVRVDPFWLLRREARGPAPASHSETHRDVELVWRRTLSEGLETAAERRHFRKQAWMARRFNEALVVHGGWVKPISIPAW